MLPSIRTSQAIPKTAPISLRGMLSPLKPHRTQAFRAVVDCDFVAEHPDELDAERGDNLTIVAQSNREWFVTKPVGKFDPTTNEPVANVEDLMDRGYIPRVEDLNRAMLSYKPDSVALGVIDPNNRESAVPNSPYIQSPSVPSKQASAWAGQPRVAQNNTGAPALTLKSSTVLPKGILLSAD